MIIPGNEWRMNAGWMRLWNLINYVLSLHVIWRGWCKKDVTPVHKQCSYIFCALTYWFVFSFKNQFPRKRADMWPKCFSKKLSEFCSHINALKWIFFHLVCFKHYFTLFMSCWVVGIIGCCLCNTVNSLRPSSEYICKLGHHLVT